MDGVLAGEALAPYVPHLVAAWDDRSRPHRAVDGSLVSVDISGFTALSEQLAAKGKIGAEELIGRISAVYRQLIGCTLARGGDVLKFRGDALLLFFPDAGHEARAADAARAMQASIARSEHSDVRLHMSCGIVSGTCDFFLVGSSHRELVVAGPLATEVLMLEDEAQADEILVAPSTAEALGVAAGLLADDAHVVAHVRTAVPPAAGQLGELVPGPLRHLLEAGATEAEHRLATTAFVKLAGTDALVRRGGGADTLAAAGRVVGEAADELGITWLESDIDVDGVKFYLVAGAPESRGDDEERMLVALRRILDAELPVELRAGVNHGHVFAGLIGGGARSTYAVMGDVVNVAARLVARAEPGQMLATEDVLRRSRTRFETTGRPFLMKGKERPVTGYRVGRILEAAPPDEDERALPLVGRAAELDHLRSALDDARARRPRTIELVGEPGIGKSRIVEELRRGAVGFQILEAHGEHYASNAAYSAIRPLLRPLAGIRPEDDEEVAGTQLFAFASAVIPDLAPWLPLLAIPFGAAVPATPETTDIDPAFRREKLLEITDVFLTRILLMPTLLLVEDSHWLDDASRELLRRVVASPVPRPWLTVITRRPEGDSVGGEQIELPPLAAEAAAELVSSAAGGAPLSDADIARFAEQCGGNPLFARELVAARDTPGALPETVETVITARIDRLEPGHRLLLRCAAVVGRSVDLELLAEVLADEAPADGDSVDQLAEFVRREPGGRLRFRHDLFRTVAYEGLSYARRRELHRGVGGVLERRRGDDAAAILSLHFFEAGEHAKAWRYAVLAGDRARAGYANVVASELYERALASAEDLPEAEPREVARVAESLGDTCELAGRYPEADSAYRLARHLFVDSAADHARLLSKAGDLREHEGRFSEAVVEQEQALALLDGADVDDEALRARIELSVAGALFRQGRFEDCEAWCGLAVGDAERSSARRHLAHAYYLLDLATTQLGRPDHRYRERALPIYEEVGDLVGQAKVLNNLGVAAYYEGRWDEAVGFYRRSHEASTRAGDVASAASVRNNEAEILSDQGRIDEAQELFEQASRAFRAAGLRIGVVATTSNLGRCAALSGRFDEAHALLDDALQAADESGAEDFALTTLVRIVECLVLEGRHREAFARATEALVRAGEGDATRTLRAQLERYRGLAEAQDRRPDDGEQHLRASLELARASGATLDIGLALHALAITGIDEGADDEAGVVLARLGIVSLPLVPLP